MQPSGGGDAFVDSRFHVAVRPMLEYAIPETLRTFTHVLLGDVPLKRLLALVERNVAPLCKDSACAASASLPPPRKAAVAATTDDEEGALAHSTLAALEEGLCDELRAHMARVCTHTHEYLTQLLDVWKRHAHDVDVACKREAARAKYALLVARRRCTESSSSSSSSLQGGGKRHASHPRGSSAALSEASRQAYQREVGEQLKSLDEAMDLVRNLDRPNLQRSESFKRACQDLRESFASAYGSVPSSTLASLKNEFEAGMRTVQQPLARDLVAFVTRRFHAP